MEPLNLENNIREKLENRELKPSPDAWKKLESQLNKKQPKKKNTGRYYMAASIAGLLITVSVFLNNNTAEVKNEIVIEEVQQKEAIQVEAQIVSEPLNSSQEKNLSEVTGSEKQPKETTKNLKPNPPQKESVIDKKIRKSEALADLSKEEISINSEITLENPISEQDKVFNNKVDEVVASVKKLQENNTEVTAIEVEALLNNARRDIQTQRILSHPKVDATVLLQDVEWELEKSFRDKVFDALGEGFKKIRTAVLERND